MSTPGGQVLFNTPGQQAPGNVSTPRKQVPLRTMIHAAARNVMNVSASEG